MRCLRTGVNKCYTITHILSNNFFKHGVMGTAEDKSILERMSEGLDNRNFSDDMQALREGVKKAADKTKEKVEEYTPEVKQLMQSVGEYFKR